VWWGVGGELVMILNDANQSMEIKTILSVQDCEEKGEGGGPMTGIYTPTS